MSECSCRPEIGTSEQGKALTVALILNAAMFGVELVGGILGDSNGLIADSLDMLVDASAYGIALAAIGRSAAFKIKAAGISGALLLALGCGVVLDVVRRAVSGSEPIGLVMVGTAILALIVNVIVLRLLSKHRDDGVHLRAAWVFTRTDVLANVGMITGGILVSITGSAVPDLVVGFGIGAYVIREAVEILRDARQERALASGS